MKGEMEMTAPEILRAAATLLIRQGWTQGVTARDAFGLPTFAGLPEATCWCMLGAIAKVSGIWAPTGPLQLLRTYLGVHGISKWNDEPGRTRAEVVNALLGAAESCEMKKGNRRV